MQCLLLSKSSWFLKTISNCILRNVLHHIMYACKFMNIYVYVNLINYVKLKYMSLSIQFGKVTMYHSKKIKSMALLFKLLIFPDRYILYWSIVFITNHSYFKIKHLGVFGFLLKVNVIHSSNKVSFPIINWIFNFF